MRFGRLNGVRIAMVVAVLLGCGPAGAERHPATDAATAMLACAASAAGTAALTSIGILGAETAPPAGPRPAAIGTSHIVLWTSGLIALGALCAARLHGTGGPGRSRQNRR